MEPESAPNQPQIDPSLTPDRPYSNPLLRRNILKPSFGPSLKSTTQVLCRPICLPLTPFLSLRFDHASNRDWPWPACYYVVSRGCLGRLGGTPIAAKKMRRPCTFAASLQSG